MKDNSLITIFHFNDVYDIQPGDKEPKGGVAFFKKLLDDYRLNSANSLTLFSGDAFSPSLLSTQFKGTNMIKPLNSIGIDVACMGNHDFDYDLDHVINNLKNKTNFPWLLSNVFNKQTQKRLGEAGEYQIIHRGDLKIGIFSLAQPEWIDTLYSQYYDIVEILPFIDIGEKLVDLLKRKQKCDIVIALTHMMKYNDIKLAKALPEIDLILGGHDHLIFHEVVNNSLLVKSGTNFKHFSCINIYKNGQNIKEKPNVFNLTNKSWTFAVQLVEVNHQIHKIIPNKELEDYVHQIYQKFAEKQSRIALYTANQIDLRFNTIRKEQTNFLQLIAAFFRHYARADCAILNSGNFRSDQIIQPGPINFKTLCNVIQDDVVVKIIPGSAIVKGLQNMVSMFPNLSGRFSALSGLSFTWDSRLPPNSRVLIDTILINSQPIDLQRSYRVAMHRFISTGGDGYFCFKDYPMPVDHQHRTNLLLLHDLVSLDPHLVPAFLQKYPKSAVIIEVDQKKYLEVRTTAAKNVKMLS